MSDFDNDMPDSPRSTYSRIGSLLRRMSSMSSGHRAESILPLAHTPIPPSGRQLIRILTGPFVSEPTSQADHGTLHSPGSDRSIHLHSIHESRTAKATVPPLHINTNGLASDSTQRQLVPPYTSGGPANTQTTRRCPSPMPSEAHTLVGDPQVASPRGSIAVPDSDVAEQVGSSEEEVLSHMEATVPEELSRYERTTTMATHHPKYIVKPMQVKYQIKERLPPGWERHTNPEGQVFFFHKESNILTETWLYKPDVQREITKFGDFLCHLRSQSSLPESQIVLEVAKTEEEWRCRYYLADHKTRVVFWFQECDISWQLAQVRGDLEEEHIKIAIEAQYWMHFEFFSPVQRPSEADWMEAFEIITEAHADTLTSIESTWAIPKEKLEAMIVDLTRASKYNHAYWVLGRFMHLLLMNRFRNFYNQPAVRLSRFDSVHGGGEKIHSLAFRFLSPLLFSSPDVHITDLEKMWVDRQLAIGPWNTHVSKSNSEWVESTFFSTILLTTNVAFLDIDSVDQHPVIKLLSYWSIISSLGSIILALLLVRQFRTKEWTVEIAITFLRRLHHPDRGFEPLAMIYSLPYALLMWGVIFFMASFLFMCLLAADIATTCSVVVMTAVVGALIVWYVHIFWERGSWTTLSIACAEKIVGKKDGQRRQLLPRLRGRLRALLGVGEETDKTVESV